MNTEKLSNFEQMPDSDLFEVGNVSEESFLNDIHSAVDTGEGKPPKTEQDVPADAEPLQDSATQEQPTQAQPQAEPFFNGTPTGTQKISVNNLLSAELCFGLIDKFLPLALVYGLEQLRVKSTASEFRATEKEKRTIVPVLDRAMSEVNLNFDNPFVALGVVLFAVYGSKGLEVYMSREKMPKGTNTYKEASEKKGRGRPKKI